MTMLVEARDLFEQARYAEAAEACRSVLASEPESAAAMYLLGQALMQQGFPAQAAALLAAIADPTPAMSVDLVRALRAAGLVAEAAAVLRGALIRGPADAGLRHAAVHSAVERGNDALRAHDLATAEAAYREALALSPDCAPALGNLATAQSAQGQVAQALDTYRVALDLAPDDANLGYAYALTLLLSGAFRDGWRWQECRRRVGPMRWNYERRPEIPQWRDGLSLAGQRVLVMSEQGFGDVIQFVRFIPCLVEQGAEAVLEVKAPLAGLFERMPGLSATILWDDPSPPCDIACPVLSLPLALGLGPDDLAIRTPLIRPDDAARHRWAAWLGEGGGRRRVGLVCSGDPLHPHDAVRSIPLRALAPLLTLPDCEFVLLQNEIRPADDIVRAGVGSLRAPAAALNCFAETAAMIAELDLVVAIDTAVAHLAATMGCPTWIMLRHVPDHRWLLGRDDSPWYPSVRLYRQPRHGDWDTVIDRVRHDLAKT